jgi:hypothetical protein
MYNEKVMIPNLRPMTYQLEIITQFSGSNTPLKSPRTAIFDKTLTVQ